MTRMLPNLGSRSIISYIMSNYCAVWEFVPCINDNLFAEKPSPLAIFTQCKALISWKLNCQFIISCINPNYCAVWGFVLHINGNLFAEKSSPQTRFTLYKAYILQNLGVNLLYHALIQIIEQYGTLFRA